MSIVLSHVNPDNSTTVHFFQLSLVIALGYVGLIVGAQKGDTLNLSAIGFSAGTKAPPRPTKSWTPR